VDRSKDKNESIGTSYLPVLPLCFTVLEPSHFLHLLKTAVNLHRLLFDKDLGSGIVQRCPPASM
jgi:hypothetical protein